MHADEDVAEPDLTPMLDVVFIMLIFFIVTATFVKEIGIDVAGQESKSQPTNSNEAIVLEINAQNRFYVNRKHVDKRALESHFARLHAEKPDAPLVILPDPEATTDALVYALDNGRLVGLHLSIGTR